MGSRVPWTLTFVKELQDSSDEVFAHAAAGLEGREFEDVEEARDFVAGLRAWAKEQGIKTQGSLTPTEASAHGQEQGS